MDTVRSFECVDVTVSSSSRLLMTELVSVSTNMLVLVEFEMVVVLHHVSASLVDHIGQINRFTHPAVLVMVLTSEKIIVAWTVLPETDVR